jgi:hypothetical protein
MSVPDNKMMMTPGAEKLKKISKSHRVAVATLLLAAVCGLGVKACIAPENQIKYIGKRKL